MKRLLFTWMAALLTFMAHGQDLNGIWKGRLTQQPGGCFPVYQVELQVNIQGDKVSGFCYHYSDVSNYVKKDYDGVYNAANRTISIHEKKVLTFHIPPDCTPCIRYFSLGYYKVGNVEYLGGEWGGTILNGSAACTPGKIVLERVTKSEFDHIREIKVDSGTIRLDFYDNAEIDGDTISVLLNNQSLVSRQRLALKPITVEIKVDPEHPEQEITMVGENLGSIPPNTALLIVTAGRKRYQLYLSSSKQKNAQVRFIYEQGEGP